MRIYQFGLLVALCVFLSQLQCGVCYGKRSLKIGKFRGFAPLSVPYKTAVNVRYMLDCIMECVSNTSCVAVDHVDQTCEFFDQPPHGLFEDVTLKHTLAVVRDILALNVHKTNTTRYDYTFSQASDACVSRGIRLAHRSELQTMYESGYELCECAWISDGTSVLPYQTAQPGCSISAGLSPCAISSTETYNAWCSFV